VSYLEIDNVSVTFPKSTAWPWQKAEAVQAVSQVQLSVAKGQTLGIVGESGCGKTTLGRAIAGIYPATTGCVRLKGQEATDRRAWSRQVQMIFQDPYSSLNPRMSIRSILSEPYLIHGGYTRRDIDQRIQQLLDAVGLSQSSLKKYPHEFSGGQRQRIGIARAIALEPEVIIADEPVSALDVSVQSQILNLLSELRERLQLTILFISHDLSVVEYLCHQVAVMYLGRIIEVGTSESIFQQPQHPYTRALLSAAPGRKPLVAPLEGDVPSPLHPPAGCHLHPRCPLADDRCRTQVPEWRGGSQHQTRCWHV
jgi:oligopeptide transport system ATP-binding protein